MNPENEAGSPQDEKAAQVVHGHSRTARRYFIFAATSSGESPDTISVVSAWG